MQWWEVLRTHRGINRRYRELWNATRQLGYWTTSTNFRYYQNVRCPEDLLPLPWSNSNDGGKAEPVALSDEEIHRLQDLMRKENEKRKA